MKKTFKSRERSKIRTTKPAAEIVNAHSLLRCRLKNTEALETIFIQAPALLSQEGLIDLTRVAVDGTRARLQASTNSERTRPAIERHLEQALEAVRRLLSPSLTPGVYFRCLRIGYFEGMDSERGVAWRIEEYLRRLTLESGIETPTREQLAKTDKKRKHKASNKDWKHPYDPDVKVTKMKDGRTHLAHKAEHAVDLETGAVVAVTLQAADDGDTTTIEERLIEAAEQLEETAEQSDKAVEELREAVADKGYHSNRALTDLTELEVRSYVSEPRRGLRKWEGRRRQREAVYGNRRRIKGKHGKRLMKLRAERVERSFAHGYETGGMRRVHLKGRENILKRLFIHVGAFNLLLAMRGNLGAGAPRGLAARKKAAAGLERAAYAALTLLCDAPASFCGRLRVRTQDTTRKPPATPLLLAA